MIKITLLTLPALLLLSGCSLLELTGKADYEVTTYENSNGENVCCKAKIFNSKNYDKLKFTFKVAKDGTMEVTLDEAGVSASDPASIMAENQARVLDTIGALLPAVTPSAGKGQ